MRYLLDQGLGYLVATHLRCLGIEAVHVRDLKMQTSTDAQIIEYAAKEQMVIVTLDADFHAMLAAASKRSPSVIRIRIEGMKAEQHARLIERVIRQHEPDLIGGAVVSITERHIRLRRLPISDTKE